MKKKPSVDLASVDERLGAEGSSLCVVEEMTTKYVLRMEMNENQLSDLELEFTHEELTVSGEIEIKARRKSHPRETIRFEERFILPGVSEGKAIEAFYQDCALHIVVPKSRSTPMHPHLTESPSVYYRPALNLH